VGDETRKANRRRAADPLFQRVFRGRGIDIGHGGDLLNRDNLFPNVRSCDGFDQRDGDAQHILRHRSGQSYDFVYSSHCLEHLQDPASALRSWFDLVRPSGFLILVVPDEDLYEQGNWPSRFNADHKWTFTVRKRQSWSPRSINVVDMYLDSLSAFSFIRISLLDDNYDYAIANVDQSAGEAEVGIEVVIQKHSAAVASPHGRIDLSRLLATGGVPGNPETLQHRLPTIRRCVESLQHARGGVFVECGCQSTTAIHSQGLSTEIWAAVAARQGGRLWTVDHDAEAMKLCRQLTSAYDNIEYVVRDSIEFLRDFDRTIDFLYLDSFGFFEHSKDAARRHQLEEISAAFAKLSPGATVLLDDANVQMWFPEGLNSLDVQGPTLLAHQFLLEHGADCLCDTPLYQRLYRLP